MATQPAPAPTAPTSQPAVDPMGIRLVVQAQSTILGSVAALLQGVAGSINKSLKDADPAALQALANSLETDMAAWCESVLANTPAASLTAAPFTNVPGYLQDVFTKFAADQKQTPSAAHSGAVQQEAHAARR